MIAGCPSPGTTENPLNTPRDGPPVVSVCYPPLVTDRAVVAGIALKACGETDIADVETGYWKRTLIFNDCPLFKKMRASFRCVSAAESDAGSAVPDTEFEAESDTGSP